MEQRYAIIVNERQLTELSGVCAAMSRLICGQLDASLQPIAEFAYEKLHKESIGTDEWCNMRDALEKHIEDIRKLCWGQRRGVYNGIRYDRESDMLWDMHQVIRKFRFDNIITEEQKSKIGFSVLGDDPLHTSDEPLIKVIKYKEQ